MGMFSIEHGQAAYRADFVFYGLAVALLAAALVVIGPREHVWLIGAWVALGLAGASAIEYALHRFVLHGLQPFAGWHTQHHERPTALISAPTLLSALLIGALGFLPALALGGLRTACALTLGLVAGYLAYGVTHHATHHWRADSDWLLRRKRWHALHHHQKAPCCYGVTTTFWDHLFGSLPRAVS